MRHLALATAICTLLLYCAGGLGAATAVTGLWLGTFDYPNHAQPSVSFAVALRNNGNSGIAVGNSVEVNTFGNPAAPVLGGNLTMRIFDDGRVEMVKVYDGKGDVSHSVWYSGRYDAASDAISGTWYISDGSTSTFTMKRMSAVAPAANAPVVPAVPVPAPPGAGKVGTPPSKEF